jgi:tripartite-type tricarboxylate transporter receptor subunit TctC
MKPILATLLTAALAFQGAAQAQAQTFPDHVIKIVSPAAAATATDSVARMVAGKLSKDFNWSVIVEDKVGANGIIAMDFVARAPADGYTLLLAPSTLYINKALDKKVTYNPLTDYTPLAKAAAAYLVLVVPANSPFNSLQDAVAYMRAHPHKLSYSTGGVGSVTHLAFAMLESMAGVQALHVPYKGGDGAFADTISGQVQMTFTAIATAKGSIAAGKVKALAVTGPHRSSALPDVPTVAELGYKGYEAVSGLGFMGPKGMPADVAARLSTEILKAVHSEDFARFASAQGLEVDALDAKAYSAAGPREQAMWQKAVAESGAKSE